MWAYEDLGREPYSSMVFAAHSDETGAAVANAVAVSPHALASPVGVVRDDGAGPRSPCSMHRLCPRTGRTWASPHRRSVADVSSLLRPITDMRRLLRKRRLRVFSGRPTRTSGRADSIVAAFPSGLLTVRSFPATTMRKPRRRLALRAFPTSLATVPTALSANYGPNIGYTHLSAAGSQMAAGLVVQNTLAT